MRWQNLVPVALMAAAGYAFENASPLLVISNEADLADTSNNIAGGSAMAHGTVFADLRQSLKECPADIYVFVHQPGLDALDLGTGSTPYLKELIDEAHEVREKPNVMWDDSAALAERDFREWVRTHCGAEEIVVDTRKGAVKPFVDTARRAISVDFAPLRADIGDASEQLRSHDSLLKTVVRSLPTANFVIVYTSSPRSTIASSLYELQEDEKQENQESASESYTADAAGASTVYASDDDVIEGDSLFDKYQFFSPGFFMVAIASIFMLWVLFVAIGWVSSLQVSYHSFDPPTNIAKKIQ